ncbi:polygalacturonase non-catalytic subunit AroGP2-like [Syzygium oleosum]|uniref:polygalacturonase non-catalytic subunit AroGP2-like n=1 Tax=Syzygium oleosum TaxID=219896 RepID=UPI0024BAD7E5|nr:polygalacturonase non-catalytic subunit AroGP2-like [Syzygium oleosum]
MISYADSATGTHLDSGKEPGKFFRESTLKSENVMPMPDVTNKMPKRSFLPRRISLKLQFSTLKLPQLNQIFRAKENSPMGKILARTIAQCESAAIYGEKKSCVSSIKDTIDFATAILGHDVMVLSTTSTGGSKQQVMVGQVKRMESSDTRKSVVCHQILFPSVIYYCHSFLDVEIYEINMLDRNSEVQINRDVVICHFNTSAWSPNHPAFLDLRSSPGQTEACHWAYENNLVSIAI